MSQPQQHISPAVQREIDELIGEITFQRVLLESIDDTVPDRQEAELEVTNEIRNLEHQIKRLKRGLVAGTPAAARGIHDLTASQSAEDSNLASPRTKAAERSGTWMETYQGREQWHSFDSSAVSTPDSKEFMAGPSQVKLPSRKRSHSENFDASLAPSKGNKSQRTSPSPYMKGPTTPSTINSKDEGFESWEDEYKRLQRLEEDRRRQEKEDEKFARILEESGCIFPNTPAIPGPSAFDRMSGIAPPISKTSSLTPSVISSQPIKNDGRNLPWLPKITPGNSSVEAQPYTSMHSRVKPEHDSTPHLGYKVFSKSNGIGSESRCKVEASSSRLNPKISFVDFSDTSDSDIEIIPASRFYGNRPSPQTKIKSETSKFSSHNKAHVGRVTSGQAPRMDIYDKQPVPHWMNAAGPSKSFGSSFTADLSSDYDMMPAGTQPFHRTDLRGDQTPQFTGNTSLDPSNYLQTSHHMTSQYDHIMNAPRQTGDEIKALLENIKPDMDLPPEQREDTPRGMKFPLYEHQKIALTWLKSMEEGTNKGGILADDMGLGKTISSLALLLARPSTDRARKTTLIVGPVALVRQWETEIKKKIVASHRLSTHLMHGQSKKLSWDEIQTFDVVMTTYGTLAHEFKSMEKWVEKQKAEHRGEYSQVSMRKLFPLLGPKSFFYRVILDEAQSIKNKNTGAAKAACNLKSTYRHCLTGTPMMNNVGELYSLIHFLRIKPYNEWTRFQQEFSCLTKYDSKKGDITGAMRKFQAVIKAILLRRTKKSEIDGKPIINLPPKTEEIQHVIFNDDEQAYYKALESKTQVQFNKYLRANTVGRNYSNILVLLLRLRQACCHPHLIMDFEESAPAGANTDVGAMVTLAKSLSPDVVNRLLEIEAFECPVCYDVAENPRIIVPCGHDTCSECLTKISDQAVQQHVAEGNNGAASCKCPTCRGDLKLENIIDLMTFKRVHQPGQVNGADDQLVSETENSTYSETDSDTESEDDVGTNGNLRGFIIPDDTETEDEIEDSDDDNEVAPNTLKENANSKKKKNKGKRRRIKGKRKKKEKTTHLSLSMLKKEAAQSAKHRRRYMRYLRKNWESSAKIDKCVELLEQFQNDGQKTIVFSQFVTLLDLIQVPIEAKNWNCLRYDGSMSVDHRNNAIHTFTDKADHNIMLISLKAGNAGLNLVAASRVIILDPFWNPFIEMQAVDRAYRIGQQRPVQVHRILIENTVEDRIIELQERKRRLVDSALDEGAHKDIGRLDVRQLAYLFGVAM